MTMIGLDYGNSTTCAAFDNGGGPQVIPWPDKGRTGPSVVYVRPADSEALVGRRAQAEGAENPDFLFSYAKRLFDVDWTDEDTGHQTTKGPDGKTWFRGPTRPLSPQEIAFCVIDEMLDCAEFRLKRRPDAVALTHPAHWGTNKKAGLLRAAAQAGLKAGAVRLLPEPTAAGFAYRFDEGVTIKHYAVYDWGAGTFDFAIIHAGRGACDAKWWDGEGVGGLNVDDAIVDWLKERYREQYGVDLGEDVGAMQRLRKAAEAGKIDLSTLDEVKIEVPLIETLPPRTLKETLTKAKLEELAKPFVDRTLDCIDRVLQQSGLSKGNVVEVVLVGGMTNMPCVGAAVERHFGRKPRMDVDPDEAVALGAARFAAMVEKRIKPASMVERVDHDFGVEMSGDLMHKVIRKGEKYPIKDAISVLMTTEQDGQSRISAHIIEGADITASGADRLAFADFDVEPRPAGEATVELKFTVDANGRKTVTGPNGVIYQGAGNG
jgi:molecular chaperone DnaK